MGPPRCFWRKLGALGALIVCGGAGLFTTLGRAETARETRVRAKKAVIEVDALDAQGNLLRTGTGFFVDRDGMAVTNRHVVEGASRVEGVSAGGERYASERVAYAPAGVDLALIKLAAAGVPFLPVAPSQSAAEGDSVLVVGPPSSLPGTDANGLISGFSEHRSLIRITASLWPGSAGSPILNKKGQVIGVAIGSAIDGQAFSYAIPAEFVTAALLVARTEDRGPPAPAVTPPPGTPAPGPETSDRVTEFMQRFMQAWNSGASVSEVSFYADQVRYAGKEMSRAEIARQADAYNTRWPKRTYRLVGPLSVESLSPSLQRVRLKAAFSVENRRRHVTGEAMYQIDLAPAADSFRVVALDEQVTKRETRPEAKPR